MADALSGCVRFDPVLSGVGTEGRAVPREQHPLLSRPEPAQSEQRPISVSFISDARPLLWFSFVALKQLILIGRNRHRLRVRLARLVWIKRSDSSIHFVPDELR